MGAPPSPFPFTPPSSLGELLAPTTVIGASKIEHLKEAVIGGLAGFRLIEVATTLN
ncbi:hypothetical protein IQ274_11165 [Nostoc sp. LEGE 12447]|uniref:hypothetical protein n=1 Tax=Nostoc sp. LEGE 12447 TaxID=1828640 RepID=UPI0018841B82|nr:hypothetical protein [Nostoc sp. LEGE 12447]MBE8998758.1 hypothetical protein [Nostoc sp. LEGE 12447]